MSCSASIQESSLASVGLDFNHSIVLEEGWLGQGERLRLGGFKKVLISLPTSASSTSNSQGRANSTYF